MLWGTLNSSQVISQLGAQNGLLTKDGIAKHAAAVPELKATNI